MERGQPPGGGSPRSGLGRETEHSSPPGREVFAGNRVLRGFDPHATVFKRLAAHHRGHTPGPSPPGGARHSTSPKPKVAN